VTLHYNYEKVWSILKTHRQLGPIILLSLLDLSLMGAVGVTENAALPQYYSGSLNTLPSTRVDCSRPTLSKLRITINVHNKDPVIFVL